MHFVISPFLLEMGIFLYFTIVVQFMFQFLQKGNVDFLYSGEHRQSRILNEIIFLLIIINHLQPVFLVFNQFKSIGPLQDRPDGIHPDIMIPLRFQSLPDGQTAHLQASFKKYNSPCLCNYVIGRIVFLQSL